MDYKELTEEQKELIDKVLINENMVLWDFCRGSNMNLNKDILGQVVSTLLTIKQRGTYETTDEIYNNEINEKQLLNEFRTTYLRRKK
jgi:hypothetical protein